MGVRYDTTLQDCLDHLSHLAGVCCGTEPPLNRRYQLRHNDLQEHWYRVPTADEVLAALAGRGSGFCEISEISDNFGGFRHTIGFCWDGTEIAPEEQSIAT